MTAGMLNIRKAAAFDLTNDVSLGAVGGAAGEGVQRLCQILLVAAVVMIFALVSRRNRLAVELGTVEEQQLVAYREIFAGGRGQGMVRKLKGELSRRKSLSEEFGRWRSTHPAASELWSASVAAIAGRPLTSLESVRANGTRAEIDVRVRNRSQTSQLQMWLSDVGLLVEPPVVKPSGRAFRATLVTGWGESERIAERDEVHRLVDEILSVTGCPQKLPIPITQLQSSLSSVVEAGTVELTTGRGRPVASSSYSLGKSVCVCDVSRFQMRSPFCKHWNVN